MRHLLLCSASALTLGFGGAAAANGDPTTCFDKATPGLVDCPAAASRYYVSLFGGASFPDDFEIGVINVDGETPLDTGYLLGLACGGAILDNLRLEGEVSYARNEVDGAIVFSGQGSFASDGEVSATFVLASLWYDFTIGSGLTPYAGGGAGVAFVDQELDIALVGGFSSDDTDSAFAWQLGAGVKYALRRDLAIELGYRFRRVEGLDFETAPPFGLENAALQSHYALAGLTYSFGERDAGGATDGDTCFDKSTLSYAACSGSDPAYYVSLFGGASFPQDVDSRLSGLSDAQTALESGFLVGGAVGGLVYDSLRLEGEVSYARNEAEGPTDFPGLIVLPTEGDLSAIYLLANLWYDVDVGRRVTPYIGGGAGVAFVDADLSLPLASTVAGLKDDDTAFAWQLGAGVKYGLSRDFALELGYRFRRVEGADFDSGLFSGAFEDAELESHNALIGVTYKFGD